MSCEKYKEMISAFIDNELDDRERGDLQTHLEICPDCSRFSKEMFALREMNKKMTPIPMPAEIEKNILKLTIKSERKGLSPFSYIIGFWRIPRGLAWLGILSMLYVAGDLFTDWNRSPFHPSQIESSQAAAGESVRKIVISDEDLILTTVKVKGGLL